MIFFMFYSIYLRENLFFSHYDFCLSALESSVIFPFEIPPSLLIFTSEVVCWSRNCVDGRIDDFYEFVVRFCKEYCSIDGREVFIIKSFIFFSGWYRFFLFFLFFGTALQGFENFLKISCICSERQMIMIGKSE